MSYLVFARKYRPQTFVEVLGQGPIVTTLTNAIRQKRIAHAYLFTGPRGTGKTSTARIFAKALHCIEGPTPTPCLSCERCQEITDGRSLDVLEIDGASNRGIDQIRALREHSKFTPVSGPFKIYIIDEVHQITSEGFNALLKILEEPPPHVLFILATTAPHKVPATILSRCQRYDFKRLGFNAIAEKLTSIAADEKLQITKEAVSGIARASSGSLRDAESLLDQLAAFTEGKIQEEDVRALLGTTDEDVFVQAMESIKARKSVQLLETVADAVREGTDLVQWTLSFLSFLRNLLVAKVGAGPLGFEDAGPESIQRLNQLAQSFSLEELMVIVQALTGLVETMRRVGEPRIPLEMVLVRLTMGESMTAVADLVERLESLQEQWGSTEKRAPVVEVAKEASSSQVILENVRAIWPKLIGRIHEQKASISAYLNETYPVAVEEADPPQIIVGLKKGFEFHRESLERIPVRQLIAQVLGEFLGSPVGIGFRIVDQMPEPTMSSPSAISPPSSKATVSGDPSFLNTVADLFQGRVIGEGG